MDLWIPILLNELESIASIIYYDAQAGPAWALRAFPNSCDFW